jgi:hypothetical protein
VADDAAAAQQRAEELVEADPEAELAEAFMARREADPARSRPPRPRAGRCADVRPLRPGARCRSDDDRRGT